MSVELSSVQVLVKKLLETSVHCDSGLVVEGQDLHENHGGNLFLWIRPEMSVGQTRPAVAARRAQIFLFPSATAI